MAATRRSQTGSGSIKEVRRAAANRIPTKIRSRDSGDEEGVAVQRATSLSFSVLAKSIDRGLLRLLFLLPENIRRYA